MPRRLIYSISCKKRILKVSKIWPPWSGRRSRWNAYSPKDESGVITRDCHQEAHQLGRAAFRVVGADVFAEGDAACNSGLYHGAMEAFLTKEGTDNLAEKIDTLCKENFNTRFGTYECMHGIGHGVMAYEDYDLPRAMGLCDSLDGDFAQNSCYGGVYMENIMVALGQGAEPGHSTKWVSNDPLFPCNVIDKKSENAEGKRYQCYQMQTGRILAINGNDYEDAARQCLKVENDLEPVCFKSLGRDAAGAARMDPAKTMELCAGAPKGVNYTNCIIGAVNVVADFWGPNLTDQADVFCNAVPDTEARSACLSMAEQRKSDIRPLSKGEKLL